MHVISFRYIPSSGRDVIGINPSSPFCASSPNEKLKMICISFVGVDLEVKLRKIQTVGENGHSYKQTKQRKDYVSIFRLIIVWPRLDLMIISCRKSDF